MEKTYNNYFPILVFTYFVSVTFLVLSIFFKLLIDIFNYRMENSIVHFGIAGIIIGIFFVTLPALVMSAYLLHLDKTK